MTPITRIAPDIGWLPISFVNVYFVGRPGGPWILVDAGLPGRANQIIEAAEARFSAGGRPEAIVLTHGHFDHAGSALPLAEYWDVPIYAHRLELPYLNGKVGVIGYCSGGRQSFLAAASLPLDAAVDCYGAFVVGTPPEGMPLKVGPIVHLANDLSCPLLGLFGADDQHPSPDQVAELDKALIEAGKEHEFHSYPGAGHAFFAVNRPAYRPEAAMDGWQKIWDFYGRHLAG